VCIITRDESIKAVHVPVTLATSNAFDLIAIDILNLKAPVRCLLERFLYRRPVTKWLLPSYYLILCPAGQ